MDLYYKIKEQRKSIEAPVDKIGCSSLGKGYDSETRKFYILVGLLFSSQTKDEVTYETIEKLTKFLGVLTPKNVVNANKEDLHNCIKLIGFHNKKIEFLIEISKRVQNKMPDKYQEVLALPGIGKKMAVLYMQHAYGISEGVSVDTHVHRISNLLGLVKTKSPEQTSKALEKIFDRDEWYLINWVFVGFGQTICKSVKPKCESCAVNNECPFLRSKRVNSKSSI